MDDIKVGHGSNIFNDATLKIALDSHINRTTTLGFKWQLRCDKEKTGYSHPYFTSILDLSLFEGISVAR